MSVYKQIDYIRVSTMNKCYSETGFDNLIKSIEFNICIILLECFVEFLSINRAVTSAATFSVAPLLFKIDSAVTIYIQN